jgi:hypothetical protein
LAERRIALRRRVADVISQLISAWETNIGIHFIWQVGIVEPLVYERDKSRALTFYERESEVD